MAETSFATVAEEHLDAVYAFLLYLTGDRTVAEDLTGETFERAFLRWRRFDPRARHGEDVAVPARPLDGTRPLPLRIADAASARIRTRFGICRAVRPTCSEKGFSPELEAALQPCHRASAR